MACVGGKDTSANKTADADSATFTKGDLQISSSATSYKSQSDLDADIAILNSSKVSACYDTLFKSKLAISLPAGSTVQSISIKITPGAAGGPDNVVATGAGKITVADGGSTQQIYVAVDFITGPLIEAEVDFISVEQESPQPCGPIWSPRWPSARRPPELSQAVPQWGR